MDKRYETAYALEHVQKLISQEIGSKMQIDTTEQYQPKKGKSIIYGNIVL